MKASYILALLLGASALCLMALGASGLGLTQADVIGLVFFGLGGLFLWALSQKAAAPEDQRFLPNCIVAAQAVRALWCLVKHTVLSGLYRRYLEGEDTVARHWEAVNQAAAWRQGVFQPHLPTSLSESHVALVQLKTTVLYYLFGPSFLLPEALVTTGTVSIGVAIYWLLRDARYPALARRAAVVLTLFLPSMIFWHTLDLKDGVTGTCAAWSLVGLTWAFGGGARASIGIPLLIGMDLLAVFYRPYVGFLLITGQGLAWAYAVRLPPTPLGKVVRVWLFLLLSPLAIWFGVREMKQTYGEEMGLQWAVEQYTFYRESGKRGGIRGSEYIIPIEAHTPTQALLQLPIRVLLLLFSPIPIWPGSVRRLLSYPEMWFIYIYVIPRIYHGLKYALKHTPAWAATILLTIAPVVGAYALKTAVSGEAMRMRTQFLAEIFLFAGIGHAILAAYPNRRAPRSKRPGRVVAPPDAFKP